MEKDEKNTDRMVCVTCWYMIDRHGMDECPRCRSKMRVWDKKKTEEKQIPEK